MADDTAPDPYNPPKPGMDRRKFVKTAMGVAALGAVGASTAGLILPLSTAGGLNIRRFPYLGAKKIGGPAPQGIPMIPLTINADGAVEGVPRLEGAAFEHSLEWYRYCGHDEAPGLEEGFTQDNVLRYFNNPTKVRTAEKELGHSLWYANKLDGPILAADFTEVGQGAPFRWRSEGETGGNIITGIVVKVDPGSISEDAKPFVAEGGLIAFCSFCAHFCCVPGYQESNIPLKAGVFDKIYCTCHDSVYDPSNIAEYTFPPNL